MDARAELEELRRLEALEQKAATPVQIPDQPAGVTARGPAGRMQMDVGMGRTPTQVGASQMLLAFGGMQEWANEKIGTITPQVAKDWLREQFGNVAEALPRSLVKAGTIGVDRVQQWIQDNPERARSLEALMLSGSMITPLRKPMKAGTFDEALTNSVTPYKNQANVAEMFKDGRLKPGGKTDPEGWGMGMGKSVFIETPMVKTQKNALKTVPGFSPYQSHIRRLDLVDQEIINASKDLQRSLDDLGKTPKGMVSKQDLKNAFSKSQVRARFNADKSIRRGKFLTDAEYSQMIEDVKYHIRSKRADGAISVGELHRQRKLVDHAFRNAKGQRRMDGLLQPTREELIWRTERDILNRLIDKVAPGTRSERARIRTLYDVGEILHQKATKGNLRFYDDAMEHVPFMGETRMRLLPRGGR